MGETKKKISILEEAENIVFKRADEKARDYGPIDESMEDAAKIASIITLKDITTEDMYKCMMALKLARLNRKYKRDNYTDLVGYAGALANFLERKIEVVGSTKKDFETMYNGLKHRLGNKEDYTGSAGWVRDDIWDSFSVETKQSFVARNVVSASEYTRESNSTGV